MEKVSTTIIGAGVVGLAIAAELSQKYNDIVLLEKETSCGQGTSSRNSEVIHAGIYYPKDSLKAKLCVEGNSLLYEYCQRRNIPHKRLGKIIVAVNEGESPQVEALMRQGRENGVEGLEFMGSGQISAYEPAVRGVRALYSPNTGIVDSHQLMKSLEREAKENGSLISYASEITSLRKDDGGYVIGINGEELLRTEVLINSAGLYADKIAELAGIDIDLNKYRLHLCKGEYFSYSKPSFLKHLVYPVPEKDIKGLGIHAVFDLAGRLRFGPNAEYVDKIDYKVDPAHRRSFYNAIKDFYPTVEEADLSPDQAGVRPKLQGPGEGFRDFVIKEESAQGFPGLINLIGIESPGLTSCLAIGKHVANLIK